MITKAAFLAAAMLLSASARGERSAARILFLHHSTGEAVWNGGVERWLERRNSEKGTRYAISELEFPKDEPYGWNNYPFDYWNIWVRHAGPSPYKGEPTLEILAQSYDVIVFKHCFPVSEVGEGSGAGDAASDEKTLANYKLQYAALKKKLRAFPGVKFLVWTGAAQLRTETDKASAARAKEFFDWVRGTWDEKGDNIFLWDFHRLETEGGLYLKPAFAAGPSDPHPGPAFARRVAPLLGRRIVDVIEGNGDSGSLTGANAGVQLERGVRD